MTEPQITGSVEYTLEPGPRNRWFAHGRNGMSLGNATFLAAVAFAVRETLRGNFSTVSRRV